MIHCAINTPSLARLTDDYHVGNIAALHAYAMQCNAMGRITSPRSATVLSWTGSTMGDCDMCLHPPPIGAVLLRIQFSYRRFDSAAIRMPVCQCASVPFGPSVLIPGSPLWLLARSSSGRRIDRKFAHDPSWCANGTSDDLRSRAPRGSLSGESCAMMRDRVPLTERGGAICQGD